MFPKYDFLFNFALVACLAIFGLFLGLQLARLIFGGF